MRIETTGLNEMTDLFETTEPESGTALASPNKRLVMWAINLGFAIGHADTEQDLLDEVGAQIKELQDKYYELLYGVASKFPDESRHETALRYIRNGELHVAESAKCEPT